MCLFVAVLGLRCCLGVLWLWRVGDPLQLQHAGFLWRWLLLLLSTGFRLMGFRNLAPGLWSAGSVVVRRLSCSARGSFVDQGRNP